MAGTRPDLEELTFELPYYGSFLFAQKAYQTFYDAFTKTSYACHDQFPNHEAVVEIDILRPLSLDFDIVRKKSLEEFQLQFVINVPSLDSAIWSFGDRQTLSTVSYVTSHTFPELGEYKVCVKVYKGGCESSICKTVWVIGKSGSSVISDEIKVYPALFKNYFYVVYPGISAINYQLINIQGKVVDMGRLSTGTTKLSIESVTSGIYLFRIWDRSSTKTIKMIKVE